MTLQTRKRGSSRSAVRLRGFVRMQLVEPDVHGRPRIVGDSGWHRNNVTTNGHLSYMARTLGALAASAQISRAGVGTGGAPADGDNTLAGEITAHTGYTRTTLTAVTAGLGSTAVEFQGTFASSSSHISASVPLSNICILDNVSNRTSAYTMFAGVALTAGSSQWNTNQDINFSYRITFSG